MTDHEFKAPTRPTCHGEGELDAAAEWLAEIRARTLDAEFIAHARSDVPWLLAEVERLRAVVARVEALPEQWEGNARLFDEALGPLVVGTVQACASRLRAALTEAGGE